MSGNTETYRIRVVFLLLAGLGILIACSDTTETMETTPSPTPTESGLPQSDPAPTRDTDRPVILAFGDSLTAGHDVDRNMSYPSQLQRRLDQAGYEYVVVNQGISGDTTSGGIARLDRALALEPEWVILELGANDALRGVPLEIAHRNLRTLIEAFESIGTNVVLAGLTLPRNYGPDFIRDFENMFVELAETHDTVLIPFFLEGLVDLEALDRGDADPPDFARYMQPDGTHPTAEGYTIVAETVFGTLEPFLEQADSTEPVPGDAR